MAWWGSLVIRLKTWSVAIGAAIAAIFGVYLYGRHSGSLREMQKAAERDRKNARKIEDAADTARTTRISDPVERLRKSGRIRD